MSWGLDTTAPSLTLSQRLEWSYITFPIPLVTLNEAGVRTRRISVASPLRREDLPRGRAAGKNQLTVVVQKFEVVNLGGIEFVEFGQGTGAPQRVHVK